MTLRTAASTALLVAVLVAYGSPAAAATACETLAGQALSKAKIDSSQVVAAGAFTPPAGPGRGGAGGEGRGGAAGGGRGGAGAAAGGEGGAAPAGRGGRGGGASPYANLPAFCRVAATLTPSSDSDIKAEVWLPASGWNGKFQMVGNGGWAGTIPYPAMAAALAAGYATAGTDMGHVGGNADFALGHPEKMVDLGYRAIHETAVQAKAVMTAHYGNAPRQSYFVGCSQGGRSAITEAQRYPEDFDGIVAGAAAWNYMRGNGQRTALNLLVNKNPDSVIPPSKYPTIQAAVLNACDARDGLKDGVMENPTACNFDYASLACKGADAPDCLTKGQVESAKIMTSPLKDPKTGRVLYQGHLWPGSELGWGTLGGPTPIGNALTGMRNVVFQNPEWDYKTMNISTDVDRADNSDNGAARSDNANLKPFFDRGGKLFMYHGWSDPQITPSLSTTYYNNVLKTVGGKAADSIALFMVPGMNHCQGGVGTDTFDKVKVIEEWVEQGKKPTRIVASHLTNGQVDKTRPLCPFGQVAKYSGTGDVNDAANFSCVADKMDTEK